MTSPGKPRVGSLRIERTLSDQDDGLLLLAEQPALERIVALRRIPSDLPEDSDVAARFRREGLLGARVHHPNAVGVIDSFEDQGHRYLVMEHVDGLDLQTALSRAGRAPARVAIAMGIELARGLQEIHSQGIVLASLSPRRILLSKRGTPRIRGFAWARELGEASPPIAPPSPYRAPELERLEPGDPRSDLYALGGVLYEMLTDLAPRPEARLPWHHAAPRLGRLIARCLRPDPDDRPETADEVRIGLERLVPAGSPADCRARIARWLYRAGAIEEAGRPRDPSGDEARRADLDEMPPGRSRLRWAAAAGAGVALLGGFLTNLWTGTEGRSPSNGGTPPVSVGPDGDRGTARVRLVVHPWAEVRVDGGSPFLTPRAEPLQLEAGLHQFELRHPRLGTVTRQVRLEPGENRILRADLLEEESS